MTPSSYLGSSFALKRFNELYEPKITRIEPYPTSLHVAEVRVKRTGISNHQFVEQVKPQYQALWATGIRE